MTKIGCTGNTECFRHLHLFSHNDTHFSNANMAEVSQNVLLKMT